VTKEFKKGRWPKIFQNIKKMLLKLEPNTSAGTTDFFIKQLQNLFCTPLPGGGWIQTLDLAMSSRGLNPLCNSRWLLVFPT
jgi:hypothetical protein